MKQDNHLATYDKFLKLRAIIIQCVALSWHDEDFKNKFKDDPTKVMKEKFNYEFPFAIEFMGNKKVSDDEYQWNPPGTGGWVGPNNTLELILPPKPKKGEESIALASYYANHLTFLAPK